MMGPRQQRNSKLFYTDLDIDARVDAGHPLRKIAAVCDFTCVRPAVAALYGQRGNPSLDPTLVLKLLFLLFFENVSSERELLRQLPCRLDWLWFLEMDLDSPIPDHSVLSKARRRWGPKVFAGFFQQILAACVKAGLVDGSRVHVDGSLITADADPDKLKVALHLRGEALYDQIEAAEALQAKAGAQASGVPAAPAPADQDPAAASISRQSPPDPLPPALKITPQTSSNTPSPPAAPVASPEASPIPAGTRYCPTDPEARLTKKYSLTVLGYKDHRVVDERVGIITATLTTHAAVDEASMLMTLLDAHALNTGHIALEPTADKGYGTAENYCRLQERGTTPCIPHKAVREDPAMFPRSSFVYDPKADTYRCPAGQTLVRRGAAVDDRYRYQPNAGVCRNCPLKSQCTAGKQRIISRQVRQDAIDWADHCLTRGQRKSRMRGRKIRVEGSFADAANNHGYKRARWRSCARVTIQNLLIAATQNLRKLARYGQPRPAGNAAVLRRAPWIAAPGRGMHSDGWKICFTSPKPIPAHRRRQSPFPPQPMARNPIQRSRRRFLLNRNAKGHLGNRPVRKRPSRSRPKWNAPRHVNCPPQQIPVIPAFRMGGKQ
jgi:transposase